MVDRLTTALGWLAGLVACALLVTIVTSVLSRGGAALSLAFVLESARDAGAAGGVADQILGTLLLVATAALVAAPLATALALAAGVYLSAPRSRSLRRALVFVELFGWGKSWLAGGLVLGAMIVPTVAFARLERIDAIPPERLEAAAGLGLSLAARVRGVVLPQSRGGLLSGLLLGLARAAGETAPILFTAVVFSGARWPEGVRESPVLALPYHIFVLAQDSYDPAAITNLWGAAVVLLALVLGTSAVALPARLRAHEESRHG
jgi:phosphate transport system permease protein